MGPSGICTIKINGEIRHRASVVIGDHELVVLGIQRDPRERGNGCCNEIRGGLADDDMTLWVDEPLGLVRNLLPTDPH